MMRVGATSSRPAGGARRSGRGDRTGFKPSGGSGAMGGTAVGGLGAFASIDALATLQGLDGADEAGPVTARLVARGEALLDELAELRDGLLSGALDVDGLRALRRRLGEARPTTDDRRLDAILDDIELRVAVELAKREAATDEASHASSLPREAPLSASERSQLARQAYRSPR